MMNEKIETIMVTKLITLSPDQKLGDAVEIFKSKRIHHLPVVENGKLVGLITTYDIWRASYQPFVNDDTLISDVMSKKIVKINPEDKVGTAAEIFLDNRFHALPVVNDENDLLGIVTSFDILRVQFKKEYPDNVLFKEEIDKGINIED